MCAEVPGHESMFNDPRFINFQCESTEANETTSTGFSTHPSTPSISPATTPVPSTPPHMSAGDYVGHVSGVSPQAVFRTAFAGNSSPTTSPIMPATSQQLPRFDLVQQPFVQDYSMVQPQHNPLVTPVNHQRSFSTGDIHGPHDSADIMSISHVLGGTRVSATPQMFSQHGLSNPGCETLYNDSNWRSVAIQQRQLIGRRAARGRHHLHTHGFAAHPSAPPSLRSQQHHRAYQTQSPPMVKTSPKELLSGSSFNGIASTSGYNLQYAAQEFTRRSSAQYLSNAQDPSISEVPNAKLQPASLPGMSSPPPPYSSALSNVIPTETMQSVLASTSRPPAYKECASKPEDPFPKTNGSKAIRNSKSRRFCRICGKGFTRPANMRSHEDVHNGVRRYSCSKTIGDQGCSFQFTRLTDLKRHAKAKHPNAYWPFGERKKGNSSTKKSTREAVDSKMDTEDGDESSSEDIDEESDVAKNDEQEP
ncbi:hypothetical protein BGX31_011328 [Mortierella sp. GBA43]|nr:hypothetical protein BGX31_011328 [Mortierella sp. GBA43]